MLPLHVALGSGTGPAAAVEIARVLVEWWPDASRVPDDAGRLPLHVALLLREDDDDNNKPSFALIQDILRRYPAVVRAQDVNGRLPSPTSILLRLLVDEFPESLLVQDAGGKTPLHVVLGNDTAPPFETVRHLVHRGPAALRLPDKRGLLPLQAAVASTATRTSPPSSTQGRVVKGSVEPHPASIQEQGTAAATARPSSPPPPPHAEHRWTCCTVSSSRGPKRSSSFARRNAAQATTAPANKHPY
jgi:hypothetical protein